MHLHPALTKEQTLEWLVTQLELTTDDKTRAELVAAATPWAEALAAVSAIVLPDELEPEFP